MKQFEFDYNKDHESLKRQYYEIKEFAKEILPKGQFREFVNKQAAIDEAVYSCRNVLLAGFKAQAGTELSGKLSKDEADELFDKKYDTDTALVIEGSVTDVVMQVAEIEQELGDLKQKMEEAMATGGM